MRLVAALPLRINQALGTCFGSLLWLLNNREARITRINLKLCFPELDDAEINRLAKTSLQETCKTMTEMTKAWLSPLQVTLGYIKRVSEDIDLDAALDAGKGIIAIVPHLGSWEILNVYAGDRFPLNILYQPPKMIALDEFVRESRARIGTRVFPTTMKGVAAMHKALRKGEVVGILPDQEPPREAGVFAPFFGIDTLTMQLLPKMAQKTGATVVCAYARRLPRGEGFEVVIKAVDEAIYSENMEVSAAALNRAIESCVRESVEQYQWEYKRFKSQLDGDGGLYR